MGKDDFKIVNPPWVYGPSEVKEWIDASYPSKKDKKKKEKESEMFWNPHVSVDVKGDKKILSHPLLRFFLKPFGLERVEEGFDCVDVAQRFLRGFAKAGFKNVFEVKVDGEVVYSHPEKRYDVKQTIGFLEGFLGKNYVEVELRVVFDEGCEATISIRKIHARKNHAVKVFFDGRIEKERVSRFLNYVKEHLDVEVEIW